MKLQQGAFIKSTELLNDTYFADATIFIKEYNAGGAVGVIINRPSGKTLNQLQEFKNSIPYPLHSGGPVDTQHLFFLHRRTDIIYGGDKITEEIYWGGNFNEAVAAINTGALTSRDIKIFVGYCGWDTGELQLEIKEGSWVFAAAGTVF
ncbi:hypothetical protein BH09BAC2_BH09BAC2_16120 [soil metagenome]